MFRRNECSQTRELLSPYLDGYLDSSQQREVEEHLQACEACQRDLDSLRSTVAILRLTPVVKPPRSFALRSTQVARPWWQTAAVMRWSTALAAALLLLVLASDGLSSIALKGSPAAAPLMAPETTGTRATAPAGDTTGAALPPTLKSQGSGDRGQGSVPQPLTPVPSKAGQSESVPGEVAPQAAPLADAGSSPAATSARDGEGATKNYGAPQPAGVARQPAVEITVFRVVEIGLASLVAILLLAGLFIRRLRR